jgi:hypothetical protein
MQCRWMRRKGFIAVFSGIVECYRIRTLVFISIPLETGRAVEQNHRKGVIDSSI